MSMIIGVIGSIQTAGGGGGGGGGKSLSWNGIDWEPVQEGQQNHVTFNVTNWDNTTVYWTITGSGGANISSQLISNNGTVNPGTGNSTQDIYFTFNADATSDGNLTYYVNLGSTAGATDYAQQGPYTCRDSSRAPAVVLDLDPVNYVVGNPNVWPDTSGNNYNAGIYSYAWNSSEASGVMVFDGTTSCEVTPYATAWDYSTMTASIWFKADSVTTGNNQTLIAKELLFKLRITGDGKINLGTSTDGASWNGGNGTTSGGENLTANVWNNITFTVDSTDNIRLYLNASEVANFSQTTLGRNNNPFDIGMWQTFGSPQDHFAGMIGEVKVWNYALQPSVVVPEYNSRAARYGSPTIGRSTTQNGTSGYIELADNTSDWALGTTYTIEFWCKHGATTGSGIHTVMGQGAGQVGIDIGFIEGYFLLANQAQTAVVQAPIDVWTHVAVVGDGVNTSIYYNGVKQYTKSAVAFNNSTDTLFIGKRGSNDFQYFNGNLIEIRINNTALYSGDYFKPPGKVTNVSGTKLCLSQLVPYDDISSSDHPGGYSLTFVPDVPTLQSMDFVGANHSYLYSASGQSHCYLGTYWTIEFWIKLKASSTTASGGIWGLFNQGGWATTNSMNIALSDAKLCVGQGAQYDDVRYTEPTVGTWTHVAIVNNGGTQAVYYNGTAQTKVSGTFSTANCTNGTDALYIGTLAAGDTNFNAKMANIRISAYPKYATDFTANTTYYVESDTTLFLGNYNTFQDTAGYYGIATSNTITSTDFPGA